MDAWDKFKDLRMKVKEFSSNVSKIENQMTLIREEIQEAFPAVFKERARTQVLFKNPENKNNSAKPWQNKKWQNNQSNANNYNAKGKERRDIFPTCKYCQKTNHLESFCWLKNAQCRKCKQFGHIQKFCKNNTSNGKQAHVAEVVEPKDEQLFTAIVNHSCNKSEVSK